MNSGWKLNFRTEGQVKCCVGVSVPPPPPKSLRKVYPDNLHGKTDHSYSYSIAWEYALSLIRHKYIYCKFTALGELVVSNRCVDSLCGKSLNYFTPLMVNKEKLWNYDDLFTSPFLSRDPKRLSVVITTDLTAKHKQSIAEPKAAKTFPKIRICIFLYMLRILSFRS